MYRPEQGGTVFKMSIQHPAYGFNMTARAIRMLPNIVSLEGCKNREGGVIQQRYSGRPNLQVENTTL